MSDDRTTGLHALDRVRDLCLAFPEAIERETWGDPTFRVREKIFAMVKQGDGRVSLWCKARTGIQNALVTTDPERFFVPPYVGHHGWIGIRVDRVIDWDELQDLLTESYCMTAPKRLSALLDSSPPFPVV